MTADAAAVADAIDDALFTRLVAIVREAGELTMRHFRDGRRIAARIEWKTGGSPVTEVDLAVDTLLQNKLACLLPDAGWLSEETVDTRARLDKRMVFVVDPIDGTRAFMDGDPRFAVCVAVVLDGLPVAGIIDAPALGEIFTARVGRGAFLNGARIAPSSRADLHGARLVGPKFLTDPVASRLGMVAQPKTPSLALRFAHTAAGVFDVAVASTNAHDWDIAAADLILHEAGASLRDIDGVRPRYNREGVTHAVLVAATDTLGAPVRTALRDIIDIERNKRGKA